MSFRRYVLVSEEEYRGCKKEEAAVSYHDYTRPVPSAREKHVAMLEQSIGKPPGSAPADVTSERVNRDIAELLALNEEIKTGGGGGVQQQQQQQQQQQRQLPHPSQLPAVPKAAAAAAAEDPVEEAAELYAGGKKQKENARNIIRHLRKSAGVTIDSGDMSFSVTDGQALPDDVVKVALAMAAPRTRRPQLRDRDAVFRALGSVRFPSYLITNPSVRNAYEKSLSGGGGGRARKAPSTAAAAAKRTKKSGRRSQAAAVPVEERRESDDEEEEVVWARWP